MRVDRGSGPQSSRTSLCERYIYQINQSKLYRKVQQETIFNMKNTLVIVVALLSVLMAAEAYVNLATDMECGLGARSQKIVGGNEASRGEFPFIVSLRHSVKDRHFCGGAILDARHILTAAHCVERGLDKFVQVMVREHNVQQAEKGVNSYQRKPERVIAHGSFDQVRLNHDLAIIKLNEGIIEWDNFTAPICLADPSGSDEVVGEMATVIGWGRLSEGGARADNLRKVDLPILDSTSCRKSLSKWFDIHQGQLCAGHDTGAKDACQGDSGGPLVIRRNGRFVLIGVVSAGVGCARPGLPGVYTRVSHYYQWIIDQLRK